MQTRTFIAAIVTSAMAITGISASSAKALSEDEIAALIFGVATLAIFGKAIEDNNRHKKPAHPPIAHVDPAPLHRGVTRQAPPRIHAIALPARCERRYTQARGKQMRGYGKRCLNRAGFAVRQFPANCQTRIGHQPGAVAIYRSKCLRRSGFQLSRR